MRLLPCPFCGAEPKMDQYNVKGTNHWDVSCMNDDCLVLVETDEFESQEEAIRAWNKRIT
jgi:hypothetical protein